MTLINKDEEEIFNYYMNEFGFSDTLGTSEPNSYDWYFPETYAVLDLDTYFVSKCKNQIEIERVQHELLLYSKFNMLPLLRWAIWFMDVVKEKDLFIGVGRGSSVSSFCLYLIELHLINPIEWDLDCTNFLK